MLSMIRSDLYRMVKSPLFYTLMVALVVVIAFGATLIWVSTLPWAIENFGPGANLGPGSFGTPTEELAFLVYGKAFAGSVPILLVFFLAYFFAADFEASAFKNLLQARGGRVSYALSALVVVVVAAVVYILLGMLATEIAYRLVGVVPVIPSFGELVRWFIQMVLVASAYGALTLLIVFLTRGKTASLLLGLFISSGMCESMIQFGLANTPSIPPLLRDCFDHYLAADARALSMNVMSGVGAYADGLVTFLIVGALCVLVMRRISLK